MAQATASEPDILDSPDYWMTALLRALRFGDLDRAADAQHKLRERFAIDVRFGDLIGGQKRDH